MVTVGTVFAIVGIALELLIILQKILGFTLKHV
jgi:hypothetical protein